MNQYEFVTGLVKNIITAIENSAVASVRSLRTNIYSSKILNFPKTQTVKGTVTVGNQKNVEKEIKDTRKTILDIVSFLKSFKLPKSIEVSNFPEYPKFPEHPKSIEVSNFPKYPDFPKEIKINNQPVEQLENIATRGGEMIKAIKALKLNPTIRVEAPKPERVIIPPPTVTLKEKEIDYERLADAVSKKTQSIDYEKLAQAVSSKIAEMVVTVGGGGSSSKYVFQDKNGKHSLGLVNANRQLSVTQEDKWGLNNTSKSGNITYTGEEDVDLHWIVRKIVKSGSNLTMTYATQVNNPLVTNYDDAWDNKDSLVYNKYSIAFAIED